jgi:hypothetical protein
MSCRLGRCTEIAAEQAFSNSGVRHKAGRSGRRKRECYILNMFNGLADGRELRRLVWVSRIGTTLFVTVMLALFALFGPFAVLAIVLVVPALITSFGTLLLSQGRLAGAAVALTATLPCAVLALTVPEGHAFTAPVAGVGAMFFVLCCAVLGLTAEEMICRPDRRRGGRADVTIVFLAGICLASTVTFVLAMVLGRNLTRAWMAPGAATCAALFALATAVMCVAAGRPRAGAMFLALTLLGPAVWGGVLIAAPANREAPSSTSRARPASRTSPPAKSHCACFSGRPCSCPGG